MVQIQSFTLNLTMDRVLVQFLLDKCENDLLKSHADVKSLNLKLLQRWFSTTPGPHPQRPLLVSSGFVVLTSSSLLVSLLFIVINIPVIPVDSPLLVVERFT